MKYVIILTDGMSDLPVDALGGKTPMEASSKKNMDSLVQKGTMGLVRTVAPGMKPGSDVANLSVLGYDPVKYYTGRSPLEAASIGVDMKADDVALRCNLVTLSDEKRYEDKTMLDYCAGDISTKEAAELIIAVQKHFGNDKFMFYNGVSYRHCLICHEGTTELGNMTPPHDISSRVIGEYLSTHENAKELIQMMKDSYDLLMAHPVNHERMRRGEKPANSIWLWGEGSRPDLPEFKELYGLKGSIISAVDLLKGIGICAGMRTPEVEGATGYIDTNFEGKAKKCIEELDDGCDFVYVHIEAPDECGHRNEPENKVKSIELIDSIVMPIVLKGLEKYDDYKIMVLPDHPTPIKTNTHSADPVPFVIYHKKSPVKGLDIFTEDKAKSTGVFFDSGVELMSFFLNSKN